MIWKDCHVKKLQKLPERKNWKKGAAKMSELDSDIGARRRENREEGIGRKICRKVNKSRRSRNSKFTKRRSRALCEVKK